MNSKKKNRRYLDYDLTQDEYQCMMANYGRCSNCRCRAFSADVRAFELDGEIYFESVCPGCGKIRAIRYDSIID